VHALTHPPLQATIVLVAIGDVSSAPPQPVLAECLQAFFGMTVQMGKPITAAAIASCTSTTTNSDRGYGTQLETDEVNEYVHKHRVELRGSAYITIAYTMADLCNSRSGMDFLFGEADLGKAVGVFSFARCIEPLYYYLACLGL
jgi:hypothetical protein